MKKTLQLMRKGFETSSGKTPKFLAFVAAFKKEFKTELESIGATKIEFYIMHFYLTFYLSGFYTLNNQVWYFSTSDVRFLPDEKLLYRTAKDYKDYLGGSNQYVKIETGMCKKMHG